MSNNYKKYISLFIVCILLICNVFIPGNHALFGNNKAYAVEQPVLSLNHSEVEGGDTVSSTVYSPQNIKSNTKDADAGDYKVKLEINQNEQYDANLKINKVVSDKNEANVFIRIEGLNNETILHRTAISVKKDSYWRDVFPQICKENNIKLEMIDGEFAKIGDKNIDIYDDNILDLFVKRDKEIIPGDYYYSIEDGDYIIIGVFPTYGTEYSELELSSEEIDSTEELIIHTLNNELKRIKSMININGKDYETDKNGELIFIPKENNIETEELIIYAHGNSFIKTEEKTVKLKKDTNIKYKLEFNKKTINCNEELEIKVFESDNQPAKDIELNINGKDYKTNKMGILKIIPVEEGIEEGIINTYAHNNENKKSIKSTIKVRKAGKIKVFTRIVGIDSDILNTSEIQTYANTSIEYLLKIINEEKKLPIEIDLIDGEKSIVAVDKINKGEKHWYIQKNDELATKTYKIKNLDKKIKAKDCLNIYLSDNEGYSKINTDKKYLNADETLKISVLKDESQKFVKASKAKININEVIYTANEEGILEFIPKEHNIKSGNINIFAFGDEIIPSDKKTVNVIASIDEEYKEDEKDIPNKDIKVTIDFFDGGSEDVIIPKGQNLQELIDQYNDSRKCDTEQLNRKYNRKVPTIMHAILNEWLSREFYKINEDDHGLFIHHMYNNELIDKDGEYILSVSLNNKKSFAKGLDKIKIQDGDRIDIIRKKLASNDLINIFFDDPRTKDPIYQYTNTRKMQRVRVNEEKKIKLRLHPIKADSKSLIWQSEDESIAIVDKTKNGIQNTIKGMKIGNTVVKIKSMKDPQTCAYLHVNVIPAVTYEIPKVVKQNEKVTIKINEVDGKSVKFDTDIKGLKNINGTSKEITFKIPSNLEKGIYHFTNGISIINDATTEALPNFEIKVEEDDMIKGYANVEIIGYDEDLFKDEKVVIYGNAEELLDEAVGKDGYKLDREGKILSIKNRQNKDVGANSKWKVKVGGKLLDEPAENIEIAPDSVVKFIFVHDEKDTEGINKEKYKKERAKVKVNEFEEDNNENILLTKDFYDLNIGVKDNYDLENVKIILNDQVVKEIKANDIKDEEKKAYNYRFKVENLKEFPKFSLSEILYGTNYKPITFAKPNNIIKIETLNKEGYKNTRVIKLHVDVQNPKISEAKILVTKELSFETRYKIRGDLIAKLDKEEMTLDDIQLFKENSLIIKLTDDNTTFVSLKGEISVNGKKASNRPFEEWIVGDVCSKAYGCTEAGYMRFPIKLKRGKNIIKVKGIDEHGNFAKKDFVINYNPNGGLKIDSVEDIIIKQGFELPKQVTAVLEDKDTMKFDVKWPNDFDNNSIGVKEVKIKIEGSEYTVKVVVNPKEDTELTNKVNKIIKKLSNQFIEKKSIQYQQMSGLKQLGKDLSYLDKKAIIEEVKHFDEEINIGTDYFHILVKLVAAGIDPTAVDGNNLVKRMLDNGLDKIKHQGNNGVMYALLGIDLVNSSDEGTKCKRKELINELLAVQGEQGGWISSEKGDGYDMGGTAVVALSPYYESNPEVKKAIDKYVEYVAKGINDKGQLKEYGYFSSETQAQAIMGLVANGIDPTSEKFTKNGNNLITALLTTYKEDEGGFSHKIGGKKGDYLPTSQAYAALVVFKRLKETGEKCNIFAYTKGANSDNVKPIIAVEGLKDGLITENKEMKFNVAAKDVQGTKLTPIVKLGDNTIDSNEDNSYKVSLTEGENIITIIAKDEQGNVAENIYKIIYEKVGNTFDIETIGNSTYKNGDDAQIAIKATNAGDKEQEATFIVALFDQEHNMKIYSFVSRKIKAQEQVKMVGGFNIPQDGKYKVKAFVWDNMDDMNVLSKKIIQLDVAQ